MFFRSIIDFFFKYFFSQHIVMEILSLEEENLVKDIGNLFRLQKELSYTAIKDIRNIFRLEEENKKSF